MLHCDYCRLLGALVLLWIKDSDSEAWCFAEDIDEGAGGSFVERWVHWDCEEGGEERVNDQLLLGLEEREDLQS